MKVSINIPRWEEPIEIEEDLITIVEVNPGWIHRHG